MSDYYSYNKYSYNRRMAPLIKVVIWMGYEVIVSNVTLTGIPAVTLLRVSLPDYRSAGHWRGPRRPGPGGAGACVD